jgi:transcriptional regulator with GAF, ATPase, and Fis domain
MQTVSGQYHVNVRVLAVTNRNLQKAAVAGVQQCLREC